MSIPAPSKIPSMIEKKIFSKFSKLKIIKEKIVKKKNDEAISVVMLIPLLKKFGQKIEIKKANQADFSPKNFFVVKKIKIKSPRKKIKFDALAKKRISQIFSLFHSNKNLSARQSLFATSKHQSVLSNFGERKICTKITSKTFANGGWSMFILKSLVCIAKIPRTI